MKTYFEGDLIRGEELNRVARQRQRKHHEITVPKPDKESYLEKGWKERREYTKSVRLWKEKPIDELLEDEVWLLFWNMGFIEMNRDRNFRIQAGPIKKQIDVFARDENYAFVVECKASAVEGPQIAAKDIREVSDLRGDIVDSISKVYNDRRLRVRFIMATRGIQWTPEKEQLARQKGIVVCKGAEVSYYNELVKHLGRAAKFQIYSILFPKEKIPESIRIPAICGKQGRVKYYSFVIQPEKLLQIAYVHHRRSTPEDLTGSYQRMLKKPRLKKISNFITRGGYFPNNIILNFTEEPTFRPFKKEKQAGDVLFGILELPRQYASAWIIDGQHRLYGYADNERRATATVPVLAFHSLDVKEQAKLFVEINREQKAVSSNLLWDLYPDIYHDSDEPEHQLLRAISLVVKKLNIDGDSPLRDHINIPSAPSKGRKITNLTMATVCDALRESNLIKGEEGLLYDTDYDSAADFAAERLKAYFDVIAKAFAEDWQKGNEGLLRTNIGIRIFIIVLRQLLKYLKHLGLERVYEGDPKRFKRETRKFLSSAIAKVKDMTDEERSNIRKASAKGLVMGNARQVTWWINEEFEGFGLEILRDWTPRVPSEEGDEEIERLVKDTEILLRSFIGKELIKLHNARWWKQGIPGGVKHNIEQQIERKIRQTPYLEEKLSQFTPEERLSHTTIGDLMEITKYTPNWEQFESTFKDKEEVVRNLDHFYRLRSMYVHPPTEIDEIAKQQGYWATRWVRKCIGLNKVEDQG